MVAASCPGGRGGRGSQKGEVGSRVWQEGGEQATSLPSSQSREEGEVGRGGRDRGSKAPSAVYSQPPWEPTRRAAVVEQEREEGEGSHEPERQEAEDLERGSRQQRRYCCLGDLLVGT